MSRWDLTGLFWDDYVAPRVAKEKIKREPPEPIWLNDDYLPGLEEARAYRFDFMSDAELMLAAQEKHKLTWDHEFYMNYSILGFKDQVTGKILKHSFHHGETLPERDKFIWVLKHFTLVGFNDTEFDIPMTHAALQGMSTDKLMGCVNDLIHGEYGGGMRAYDFYKMYKIKPFPVDNIDLIELTPLGPSLKICAGRIHAPRMADLPFAPGKVLNADQKLILDYYWANDLDNTTGLFDYHKEAIALREVLTEEYGVDVRSKSDPQIAEAVIRAEITRLTKQKHFKKAEILPGSSFKYVPPSYVKYTSPTMQWVLDLIKTLDFVIDEGGSPMMPDALAGLDINIGASTYRMGIGGLHSKEKKAIHLHHDDYELSDNDVTSYYPSLIIQQGMYPPNVGPVFLQVFKRIYDRRLKAKADGIKLIAECLKIVLNGTFGKTGERGGWSIVYYPRMMIQVTLSGQLALMMLIERLELAGISVVSGNTDGIMVKCHKDLLATKEAIIKQWELETGLGLESKIYKSVFSANVNNYIALYAKLDTKETGAWQHAKAVGWFRKTLNAYPPKWNPTCDICSEAVIMLLSQDVPVETTIRECTDIRKFVEVRKVNGGAFKDGEYLAKAIRWYYSTEAGGPIVNAKNGNHVPRSAGARPCMVLPTGIPEDLDYDFYIARAYKLIDGFSDTKAGAAANDDDEEEKAA